MQACQWVLGRPLSGIIGHVFGAPRTPLNLFAIVCGHAPPPTWFGGQSLYFFRELASSRGMSLGGQSLDCSPCQGPICFSRGRMMIQFSCCQLRAILEVLWTGFPGLLARVLVTTDMAFSHIVSKTLWYIWKARCSHVLGNSPPSI